MQPHGAAVQGPAPVGVEPPAGRGGVEGDVEHLADLGDAPEFNEVYREFFTEPFPVRTTVGSVLAGILVEIDLVARIPS